MKPSARRRLEREVDAIMQRDSDHCSLCRKPFPHNSRSFGGATRIGTAALAGECCSSRMTTVLLMGVYMAQDFGDLAKMPAPDKNKDSGRTDPASVESAISAWQDVGRQREAQRKDVARRAGIDPAGTKLVLESTDWKTDDSVWFEQHNTRTHRIRDAYPAEFGEDDRPPPGHRNRVLVRQIEPGARIRMPFAQNSLEVVPDEDATLHALFDMVAEHRVGSVIPRKELEDRTAFYRGAKERKPS